MSRSSRTILIACLALATAAAAYGGWATITVHELPDHLVAGEPTELAFTLRQHGQQPIRDVRPTIVATSGDATVKLAASPAGKLGAYSAKLAVPEAGRWQVTIHSGFGNSRVSLLPLAAVSAGASTTPLAAYERGHGLFVAKGCLTCHVHRDVKGSGEVDVGPELTGRRYPADYLERFLADPSITPARGEMRMPNLDLNAREIAALVAFINGEARRNAEDGAGR